MPFHHEFSRIKPWQISIRSNTTMADQHAFSGITTIMHGRSVNHLQMFCNARFGDGKESKTISFYIEKSIYMYIYVHVAKRSLSLHVIVYIMKKYSESGS